jgi:uncharacterized membrane protein YdjX (TVP38/TMEM64 family)
MIKSVAEALKRIQLNPWFKRLLCLMGLIALLLWLRNLPLMGELKTWLKSFQSEGAVSMIRFGGVGVVLILLFMPVSVVLASAGFVFGWMWGFVVASGIILCGLSGGFGLGRWLWPKISSWSLFQHDTFHALRKAIESEGNMLICLIRMTPFLHFMTGNLFFGSLRLRFWPYLGFSYLGTVPGTLLLVYSGHLAAESVTRSEGLNFWHGGLLLTGLVLVTFLGARVTGRTRRILSKQQEVPKS